MGHREELKRGHKRLWPQGRVATTRDLGDVKIAAPESIENQSVLTWSASEKN